MPRKPRTEPDPKTVRIVKYCATVFVGIAIAVVYWIVKGMFKADTALSDRLRMACDGVTIPGILMLCLGLLSIVVKDGTFDGLGYTFKTMRLVRRNYRDKLMQPTTYYDYKESVKGKRHVSWHLIICGAGFLLVAVVLAILHGRFTA